MDNDYDLWLNESEECSCGKCKLCEARALSEDDTNAPCSRCGGCGCAKCE